MASNPAAIARVGWCNEIGYTTDTHIRNYILAKAEEALGKLEYTGLFFILGQIHNDAFSSVGFENKSQQYDQPNLTLKMMDNKSLQATDLIMFMKPVQTPNGWVYEIYQN
ncbi:hypothetical protein SCHPADRAFT_889014 [Schizopora paradoxa]|uniref:Uncharacterized protein n=1 Tax=Schizopora paradoxa TaxID=27342 RepID=A0A0H2RSL6_9AGAM|nr:hypothetical protein SCHPADRAFT_889014 [Schizopora paradoxa]